MFVTDVAYSSLYSLFHVKKKFILYFVYDFLINIKKYILVVFLLGTQRNG